MDKVQKYNSFNTTELEYVAPIGKMENAYKILVGNSEGKK
jgi:hypothetical protein